MGEAGLDVMKRWFAGPNPALLAEKVSWWVPEYPVTRAHYVGPRQVFEEFFPELKGRVASWGSAIDETNAVGDDRVVVIGRYKGTRLRDGAAFESPFVHVWTVSDGLITKAVASVAPGAFGCTE
jgi:ketosteroid isomerase-like protein